jgi:hypothetical protein
VDRAGPRGLGRAPGRRSVDGGESGAWLDGEAAAAVACDAAVAPYVTGDVDPGVLEDLIRLCVQFDELRRRADSGGSGTGMEAGQAAPAPDTTLAWDALEQAVIGKTIFILLHSNSRSELV